jgi:hypothetical protein
MIKSRIICAGLITQNRRKLCKKVWLESLQGWSGSRCGDNMKMDLKEIERECVSDSSGLA